MIKINTKKSGDDMPTVRVVSVDDEALRFREVLKDKDGTPQKDEKGKPVYDDGMDPVEYLRHFDDEDLVVTKEGQTPTWFVIRKLSLKEQRQLKSTAIAAVLESNPVSRNDQEGYWDREFACEFGLVEIEGVEVDGVPNQTLKVDKDNREAVLEGLGWEGRQEIGSRVLQWTQGLKPRTRAEGVTEGN